MKQLSDHSSDARTLLVCFSLALAFLIPLRFYEMGEQMALGVQNQAVAEKVNMALSLRMRNQQQLALNKQAEQAVLGATTEEQLTGKGCIDPANAIDLSNSMYDSLKVNGEPSPEDLVQYSRMLDQIQARVCKN